MSCVTKDATMAFTGNPCLNTFASLFVSSLSYINPKAAFFDALQIPTQLLGKVLSKAFLHCYHPYNQELFLLLLLYSNESDI